jgi:hypothetical protein
VELYPHRDQDQSSPGRSRHLFFETLLIWPTCRKFWPQWQHATRPGFTLIKEKCNQSNNCTVHCRPFGWQILHNLKCSCKYVATLLSNTAILRERLMKGIHYCDELAKKYITLTCSHSRSRLRDIACRVTSTRTHQLHDLVDASKHATCALHQTAYFHQIITCQTPRGRAALPPPLLASTT